MLAKTIRNYVATGLIGATAAGANVFAARHRALDETQLPALLVYTDTDRVVETQALGVGVRRYVRELEVHVSIVADAGGTDDEGATGADLIDDLAEQVEAWFFDRETNDPVWVEALLSRFETGIAEEGARPKHGMRLVFDVTYFDEAPKPSVSVPDDLTLLHVEQDIDNDPTPDAIDDIVVSQS